MRLILASTSPIRAHMLDQAGVAYRAVRPALDEQSFKAGFDGDGEALARLLAAAKAQSIAADPSDTVIGSDSTLTVDGKFFSKPRDRAEAAAHLAAFSGRVMILASAVALVRDGRCIWCHSETARLSVRDLSPDFIEAYLAAEWPDVAYCVGVFRIEGRGVTLFDAIDGSYFTILGMPLLALLGALRERGLMPA